MNILVTGCDGFIGKNLIAHLKNFNIYKIKKLKRKYLPNELNKKILSSDIIFHLAGVNRGVDRRYFFNNNYLLTKKICTILKSSKKKLELFFLHLYTLVKVIFMDFQSKNLKMNFLS